MPSKKEIRNESVVGAANSDGSVLDGDRNISQDVDQLRIHVVAEEEKHNVQDRLVHSWTLGRVALLALLPLVLLVCVMLAEITASQEMGSDVEDRVQSESPVSAAVRRTGDTMANGSEVQHMHLLTTGGCRTAQEGEDCHRQVTWAMQKGIWEHPEWYPGLDGSSGFEDFQAVLHSSPYARCPLPCWGIEPAGGGDQSTGSSGVLGYAQSGRVVAPGQWCAAKEPMQGWALNSCGWNTGLQVKVLTYNLFWWNLFGLRKGDGGSAGKLVASAAHPNRFDVMGFQECEDIDWVLGDAGLWDEYVSLTGPHALCMAFNKARWGMLSHGALDVAEDRDDQWYGTRAAMWARLRNLATGEIILFVNHHGPLPLDTGGRCGGEATAYNLLKVMATQAYAGDAIILVGDFNARPHTQTLSSLRGRLHQAFTGSAFGGVDHILSSCGAVVSTRNLGSGGSDHDALEATIRI